MEIKLQRAFKIFKPVFSVKVKMQPHYPRFKQYMSDSDWREPVLRHLPAALVTDAAALVPKGALGTT